MKKSEFRMRRSDNSLVHLADILKAIPNNNWVWAVQHFYGVGEAPGGLSMPEFEEICDSTPGGVRFSWDDIKNFASHINEVWDCFIVAVLNESMLTTYVNHENINDCIMFIEGIDSTIWNIILGNEPILKTINFDNI